MQFLFNDNHEEPPNQLRDSTMSAEKKIRKLGVIGDVHAEHRRLSSAIKYLQSLDVDAIVCTGDIVDGLGCPNESIRLLDNEAIHTVRGNHDRWILEGKARHVEHAHLASDLSKDALRYLESLPRQVTLETIAGRLLLCHGVAHDDLRKVWPGTASTPVERSYLLDSIILENTYKYIINGHMHFRTLIHFENLTLINAGTLKGEYWPGFSAIDFDTQQISAFEFNDNQIKPLRERDLADETHKIWVNTQSFCGKWDPVMLF
ncbi:MAG: metallophosphoesterase family protein [Halioglobus sp.]|nr:metallophosphoesterase family protein [Halioglobus sp.]